MEVETLTETERLHSELAAVGAAAELAAAGEAEEEPVEADSDLLREPVLEDDQVKLHWQHSYD